MAADTSLDKLRTALLTALGLPSTTNSTTPDLWMRYMTANSLVAGALLDRQKIRAQQLGISLAQLQLGLFTPGNPSQVALSGSPSSVTEGGVFDFTPITTGGSGTKTYSISAGTLPAWASFNTSTGRITGTTVVGSLGASVTIQVVDSSPLPATLPITIVVNVAGVGPFDSYYAPGFALRADTTYAPSPVVARPSSKATGYATPSYIDADFDTRVYRATDVADGISGGVYMRHEYSKKQAFNCDNTMFIARGSGGHWWLYDALTFQPINGGSTIAGSVGSLGSGASAHFSGDCEAMWHPTDPNVLWRTDNLGSLTWYSFNVTTKVTTTLFSLSGKLSAFGLGAATRAYFGGEGRPSDDGTKFGFMLQDNAFNMVGVCMYDKTTDTVTAGLATTNKPNWVGTNPNGDGLVMSWYNNSGKTQAQCSAASLDTTDGVRAYNAALTSFVQLTNKGEHADLMKLADGTQVYVSLNIDGARMPGITDGHAYYSDLATGTAVELPFNAYSAGYNSTHYSGLAVNKPGWVAVSCYGVDQGTYDREVFAMELVPSSARILRIAHDHTEDNDYWSEPQVAVDRDFTRVLYASDYGTTDKFETYMVGLPSWAIPSAGVVTPAAPVNTVAPVISGGTTPGSTQTVADGTWTGYPTPTVLSRQWKKNGSDISGETGTTYTMLIGDVGNTITCTVTKTNSSGNASATSNGVVGTSASGAPSIRASDKAGASSANSVTSTGITTATGDFLAVVVIWQGGGAMPAITDSKGNTFAQSGATATTTNGGYTYSIALAVCYGNVSIGGTSHIFTATKTAGYPTIFPVAVQGAHTTAPIVGYISAADSTNTFSSGDITPSSANTLVLSAAVWYDATGLSVAGPYAVVQSLPSPTYWPGSLASYTQSTAAATSAQWTVTTALPAALLTFAVKAP